MATPRVRVVLEEKDVPGASFQYSSINKHSVVELKRWLTCRGLKVSGKKALLVERCQHAVDQKLPIDPAVDGGAWYNIKAASQRGSSPANEDLQPKDGNWKDFPQSGIPVCFNSGRIYHHIIESVQENSDVEDEGLHCQTTKPLRRGRQLFESQNVTMMQDLYQGNQYHVKAKVLGSMRKITYNETS